MSTHSASQDTSQSTTAEKRRKRRERNAKSRTPEPKDIVSGAGQPLDLSVRRDLEEQLGHDFSQVRLHTDRESGELAEMMGADAFAVGQDIFFRAGTYRPGTADGQRLLAHELLHTVQNPHGLGALRAGRDLGAVSLPQESIEREAESAAQSSVLGALRDSVRTEETPASEVEEGRGTPGWLRYATVSADRMRLEQIDPATLVDRLTNGIVRSLRGDPEDLSGRVRMELARMAPDLQDSVLDRLEVRLLSPEYDRLLDLTEQPEAGPLGLQPSNVPEPVPDAIDLVEDERQTNAARTEGEKKSAAARDEDAENEKKDAKGRDGEREKEQTRAQQDASAEEKEAGERKAHEDERAEESADSKKEQQQEEEQQGEEREKADQADAEKAQEGQEGAERTKEERKEQREREEQDPEQTNRPGADKRKRKDDEKKPADGSKQEELEKKKKEQQGPVRPEKVDERADQRDSALSEHGLHEKDEDEGEPREEEQPIGLEAGAEKAVDGGQEDKLSGGSGKGEAELKPDDFLPDSDPDLSSVPTADTMQPGAASPAVPAFPAPPPTKAEKVQKERENEADEEEDEDSPEAETKAPGEERGPVEGEAPQPEHGPASEAPDRSEKDLQPEKPVEQEVGPDPEAEEQRDPEQEAEGKKDPEQQQDQDEDGAKAAKQDAADKDAERDGDSGDGDEAPDAKEAQDEQQDKKDQDEHEEKKEAKGQPEGAAADKPAGAAGTGAGGPGPGPAAASLAPPAGAHTERTSAEDRHPSPAARRTVEPVRGENEAPAPKSAVPKEAGPGAAPSGAVGANEPAAQPKAAAGPGGAPSVAQAAVSPVGEQAENPGKMGAPAPEGAKAQPDASLEKDGGGCAPPAPAAEKEEKGGACGGGGGGEQAPEEKQEEPPDVSGQDPKAALSTVSKLSPDQAQAAMPGVDGAADKKVNQEQKRLQANPPKRERPSGAPQTQSSAPEAEAPETAVSGKLQKVGPEDQGEKQRAKGSEKAQGAKPTDNVKAPVLPPTKDGKLTAGDAKSVEAAADKVPTTDPELRNKTVGPAPKIKLEGESDPKRTDKQAEKLKEKQGKIQDTGRADASKPMGEDKIFPNAPKEQLTGKASGRAGGGGGRQSAGGAAKSHVGVVAKQERGGELKSGAAQSQTDMSAKEKEHQQGEQQAKQEKQQEIDNEVARNAEQQTAERGRAAEQAGKERQSWRDEQDKKIEHADKDTEKEHKDGNQKISKERDGKDKEVEDRKNNDNKDIDTKAEQAEKDAEKKKEEKKGESDSLFGKILDAVGDFFKGLLDAVTAIFDAARNAINSVIDKFKEFANKAIDAVRDFAIKAINVLADALIAIGDVLLAAFPELRDKFRKAIEGLRDAAIATVNKLADGLKKAVNTLLDALAAGLNKLLDVLEAGIKAVIKAYQAVITAAIKFAEAAIEALGKFAALVADIAPDPGGWLAKAGSAAKTGIQEHLWGAIKSAVKQWFDTKVEGILGLGKAVINVLVKGCMSLKQIGKMAWDAIVASLPMMIASLVVEKVVSMIIPAAGAILTIVQGLMAAWESISSILTAFSKFFAYLKAVKAGPAACLFAEAVAAGVVALLDFITNFLLQRLGRATKGVGKRLKAMAQKITAGLKKTGKGARKAAGKAVNAAKGAARKAAQALRKPARPTKPKGPRVPSRPGASTDRTPGGGTPKHQPKTHPTGRPTSKTPDPAKKKHDDETDAKKTRDESTSLNKHPDRDSSDHPKDRTPDRDAQSPKKDKAPDQDAKDRSKDKTPDKGKDKDGPDGKKDKSPDKPSKKKETEAPKRAKPRKPKSPLGRALKKIKGKVKSALKKVRNAGKALGKKLRKSKVGKALKNTAKRARDFFKKKRDAFRDNKNRKRQQEKRKIEERKNKENSPESKKKRVEDAMARVTRLLTPPLKKGIPNTAFRASLAGMKAWYRLTSLASNGSPHFKVLGKLNPEAKGPEGELSPKKVAYSPKAPKEDRNSGSSRTDPEEVHSRIRATLERMDREGDSDVGKRSLLEQIMQQARNTADADKDDDLAELREDEHRQLDELLDAYEASGHKRSEIDPKKEREEKEADKEKEKEEDFRTKVNNSRHVPPRLYSGAKHWKGNTDDKRKKASENGGAGQFVASLSESEVKQLEREALLTGKRVKKSGTIYGWKRFGRQIGWANGQPAYVLRAEMTDLQNKTPSIHSHPRLEMDLT